MTLRQKRRRKPGRPKGRKDKTKRKAKGQGRNSLKVAQTIIEGQQRELARLRTEVSDLKGAIEPVQEMYREARRDACAVGAEQRRLAAAHEYAYGSGQHAGRIRLQQAEIDGLRAQAMAPSAAWDRFVVWGSDASIEEVWRLVALDRLEKETR